MNFTQLTPDDARLPKQSPSRLWGLDPLFECWVKVFIRHINALSEFPDHLGTHKLYERAISRVHILGRVVGRLIKTAFVAYTVDDGTSLIRCVQWFPRDQESKQVYQHAVNASSLFDIGHLVSVCGKLRFFRGKREINVDNTDLMRRLYNKLTPAVLDSTVAIGMHPDWVEAAAFAWLAHQTLEQLAGNAPVVTGAAGLRILGGVFPGNKIL